MFVLSFYFIKVTTEDNLNANGGQVLHGCNSRMDVMGYRRGI